MFAVSATHSPVPTFDFNNDKKMAGRKRSASSSASSPRATRSRTAARGNPSRNAVPDVVRELLTETRRSENSSDLNERPAKRLKRPGEKPTKSEAEKKDRQNDVNEDDEAEFEDVDIPEVTVQTIWRENSVDEEEDELVFEDVKIGGTSSKGLELNLTAQKNALAANKKTVEKRRLVGREERERREDVHKTHLLCLLAHVERRNRWCNDAAVQGVLKGLLTERMLRFLNPKKTLIQFGQTESLKKGLRETADMFKVCFKIVERGLRRALWAENEEQLKDVWHPFCPCSLLTRAV